MRDQSQKKLKLMLNLMASMPKKPGRPEEFTKFVKKLAEEECKAGLRENPL